MDKVKVICPACGQETEAVLYNGEVSKGYCSVKGVIVEPLIVLDHEENS